MYQTTGNSADEERIGDLELNSVINGGFASLEHSVELGCLWYGSGETIEDETKHVQLYLRRA
jgi:hypothetical protein